MKTSMAWLHAVLVIILLTCAVGVRVYHLNEESLWVDENITWHNLELPRLKDYLSQLRERDTTFVPAYYTILYYWGKLTGHDVTAARALSVALGVITVLLVYLLARRAFGPTAGIAAMAMAAFSNTHVYYTQEIRVYALYCMALLLSVWSLDNALRRPRPHMWALHQFANFLLVFSHYFGAFFLLAEGLYLLLFHRAPVKRLAAWFAAQAAVALLLGWWMLGIRKDVLDATTDFLTVPKAAAIEYAFTWTALYWPRDFYSLAFLSRIVLDAVLLLGFYCFWTRMQSDADRERWQRTALYLLLMILPVAAALAACYLWRPALTLRYVLPSSLAFFILVGGAVGSLPVRPLRWGLAAGLVCLMAAHQVEASRPYRPNMQRAGNILSTIPGPEDALILANVVNEYARRMYVRFDDGRTFDCPDKETLPGMVSSQLNRHPVVWVLCEIGYSRNYSSQEDLEAALRRDGILLERVDISTEHYTFMTNSNWPELSNIAQGIVLYKVSRPRPDMPSQVRSTLPAAISIFNS